MENAALLWRRIDQPGHEAVRSAHEDHSWRLTGTAVFADDGQPCRLDYSVACDAQWKTRGARVTGWVGDQLIEIEVSVDATGRWFVNGAERREVEGCIDLDLSFSPATNLLPIRRLGLAVGEQAHVLAAWLRFPGFALEPLDQVYRHTGARTYVCESAGGSFVAELQVNEDSLVTDYPGLWACEAGACAT